MTGLEGLLASLLKVPAEPDPPLGAPDSLRVFRAAKPYVYYRFVKTALAQLSAIVGLLFVLWWMPNFNPPNAAPELWELFTHVDAAAGATMWTLFELLAVGALAFQAVLAFSIVGLDYRYRWYMTTDRSLRVREGILSLREQTMMFSNVQNVAVRQGPLQRLLGISDVEVRSAGGGGASDNPKEQGQARDDLHVCRFRGVSNPGEIRDLIVSHLRKSRSAGLGDPDEPETSDGAVAAGRDLLDEARRLRRALAG